MYSALYFTVARSAEGRPPGRLPHCAAVASAGSCVFFVIVSVSMPRSEFTLAHRIVMYDSYVRTESCREVTRLCRDRFPDIRAPHRDTVRKLVNRFRETGSVLGRKPQRTHVLTEEKLDEIGQTLERSPRKSLSRLSQETGVSQFSAWKATKLLKLKPYKITAVQELQPRDTVSRVRDCCNCKFAR